MGEYHGWRRGTARERAVIVAAWVVAVIVGAALFFAALMVIGSAVDGITSQQDERRSCQRAAANGYEIEQCR